MGSAGCFAQWVGWLHPDHAFRQGEVSADFTERLREFALRWGASTNDLDWGVCMGFHSCEFCDKSHNTGRFGVPSGNILFVAPTMIVHYVEQHRYAPPNEFVSAVLKSPLPGTQEYQAAVARFKYTGQGSST